MLDIKLDSWERVKSKPPVYWYSRNWEFNNHDKRNEQDNKTHVVFSFCLEFPHFCLDQFSNP